MTNNNALTPVNLSTFGRDVDIMEIRRDPERFPRIGAFSLEQATQRMIPIVYAAYLYRNQATTQENVRFVASALCAEIQNETRFGLRHLSWQEIGMVIRTAVLGGAREMYGVSVASLYSALVDYAKGEGHEASKKAR